MALLNIALPGRLDIRRWAFRHSLMGGLDTRYRRGRSWALAWFGLATVVHFFVTRGIRVNYCALDLSEHATS